MANTAGAIVLFIFALIFFMMFWAGIFVSTGVVVSSWFKDISIFGLKAGATMTLLGFIGLTIIGIIANATVLKEYFENKEEKCGSA